MKIQEQVIQEIKTLDPIALTKVYELIGLLKQVTEQQSDDKALSKRESFLEVREALECCSGSLSRDIELDRAERI